MIKLIKLSYAPADFGKIKETRNIRKTSAQFYTGAGGVEWLVAPSPRSGRYYPQLFFKNPSDGTYIFASEICQGLADWRVKATKETKTPDGTPVDWTANINRTLRDLLGENAGQY